MESAEVSAVLHELTAGPSAARPAAKRSFLPEFADERNSQLDREIQALEAELERTQISLDENEEHTRVLAEHLDSVRVEIKHTQARLTARTREVEGEAHLRAVAERESGRLRSDAARLAERRAELAQRVTAMETEAFKAGERLDQFRLVQNWNQEELEQWAAAAKAKEEDRLALERYKRQDEAKVKELGMQLERAAREVHQGRRDLEDALTETQAAQGELGKAAQDFRRLHAERAELLAQWEAVAEAVRRRDADILAAGQEVAERKARLAGLQLELATQTVQLDAEVAAGAAIQKRIAARERQIKAHYDTFHTSQAAAADAEDALDLMANSLGAAEDEAQRGAAACGHLRAELERRRAAVEAAQSKLEAARVRLALEGQQLGSLQSKVQELEALRAEEVKRGEALERELAGLAQRQFRASQALHEAQEEGKRLASEISGARAQGRNLSHRIGQLEEQLVHQQEVQYNTDFQVVQMERRVARAEGHRSKDETEALSTRIKGLEAQLQEAAAAHGMLVDEVKRAEDDYARAQRASQAVQGERAAIMDDMARLTVEAAAVGRALKAAAKEREGKLVEVDLKKLEVRRLRTALGSKAGEVESLEARRRALEGGMRERRAEVEVQLELMQNEARLLRDEVHRVTLELQARQLALSKLQKKHEALVLKGRGQDGEEAHSQAYYIIKAAQERQELTEQAEALRAKIGQAERECRALEATLRRLLGANSDWHYQARHTGAQELVEEQAALRVQLDAATAQLRGKQAEEGRRSAELEEIRARLANAVAEEAGMRQRLEGLLQQKAEAQAQLAEQLGRQQRAAQHSARLLKQLQAKGAAACKLPAGMTLEALAADVQLAQVKEATRGMLEALRAVAAEHPQLNLLQRVESEAGVKLPAAEASCASRPGSAAPSARSGLCGSPSRGGSRPTSSAGGASGRLAVCRSPVAVRSPGGSRPGSCAGRSLRSAAAGASASSPGTARSPAVQTAAAPPTSEGQQHRQEQATSKTGHQHHHHMPISQPCTTKECQEAALAALRAQRTGASGGGPLSPTSPAPAGTPPSGTPGQSAFNTALAQRGQSFSPDSSGVVSPPDTPASALKSPTAAAATPVGGGSGNSATLKAVRFDDQKDNLHVGLDSRASSADSLHRTYDEAVSGGRTPPTASGFHVVHTAGGRLDAVSSSARWEDVVGYSRAVKRGPFIYVSGTSAVDQASGRVMYRRDAYKQTRLAFTIVERALAQVGASLDDVVRTRLFVRNLQRDGEGISRAHGEVLGHVKPASSMVEVSRLVHEDILVLLEVDAILNLDL